MKATHAYGLTFAAVAFALAGGYWLGAKAPQHGEHGASPSPAAQGASKKILYYRNPMGLPDTSPVPKKDPMGMDYIPVFEGGDDADAGSPNALKISVEKVQKLGVRSEPAQMRVLAKTVRALGRVEVDERRLVAVAPKFEGWIDKLHVNTTGQVVSRGQPLFEVYSPELVSAQREYAIAAGGATRLQGGESDARGSMSELANAALTRLRNWDISDAQLKELASGANTARRTLTFRSPANGVVMEKKAVQGMRFEPGESLYQIADLSSVWVVADVYEQDVGRVSVGQPVKVSATAYPGKSFEGTVSYVYPTLNADTRTVPVRIELANPKGLLKPGLFAAAELQSGQATKVLTVPSSAIIDSGTRQVALVQLGEGRFEPRTVKLGAKADNFVEVTEGVKEGESVVIAANFLIDAESNLKAAVGGFGHAAHGGTVKQPDPAQAKAGAAVGHAGEGTLDAVAADKSTITLSHGPIASLKWPAMAMDFGLANPALLKGLAPGAKVKFEMVERKPGEWVITSLSAASAASAAAPNNEHAGH